MSSCVAVSHHVSPFLIMCRRFSSCVAVSHHVSPFLIETFRNVSYSALESNDSLSRPIFSGTGRTSPKKPSVLGIRCIHCVLFFEFSLCLSRACLGKMIIFSIKWRKKWRFRTCMIGLLHDARKRSSRQQHQQQQHGVSVSGPRATRCGQAERRDSAFSE
jgi:hypothetical protein